MHPLQVYFLCTAFLEIPQNQGVVLKNEVKIDRIQQNLQSENIEETLHHL